MTSAVLGQGLLAALGAATLYGVAPVAQGVAAQQAAAARGVGLGLTARLFARPVWVLGLLCEFGGFIAEALAFSKAPATLVAPLMACDVMVFVLLTAVVLHERLGAAGLAGVGAMVLGIAVLAYSFGSRSTLGSPADTDELVLLVAAGIAGTAVVFAASQWALRTHHRSRAAAGFGLCSGIAYGLATLMTRQFGLSFDPGHPFRLLSTLTPYALAGFSVAAVVVLQRGLQISTVLSYPVTSVTSAFLPVILGSVTLSDTVPGNAAEVSFVAALLAVAAGVVLLGWDRVRSLQRLDALPGGTSRAAADAQVSR